MSNVSSINGLDKRVPKLRFPEFCGEWEEKTLSDLFSKITTKNKNGIITNVICNSAKFGLIPQRDYFDKDIANEDNTNGYYIIEKGDFVYNPRKSNDAPYGPVSVYKFDDKGIVSPLYLCFTPILQIETNFFLWYFKSPIWHRYIYLAGDSGVRHDRVSMKDSVFFSMPLNIPTQKEQQKIASFLTLLDKRIEKQRQLVEVLKSYKRGLLLKLFPQKGDSTPQYRFAGFTEPWEQRKFSEIVEIRRGLTYKPSDICENGVRVLRSSNIDEDSFILRDDDVFVKAESVNIDYTKESNILITAANGSSRLVGKHAIIEQISPKSTVHGGFMLLGATNEPYFVNASMGSSWYRNFIKLFVAGGNGAIGNLNKNDLGNQNILIPSEEEQRKIGNFFKQLDHLITLHQRKLNKYESIKSGLLQQLFI